MMAAGTAPKARNIRELYEIDLDSTCTLMEGLLSNSFSFKYQVNTFGGQIMAWMVNVAAIAARYSQTNISTVFCISVIFWHRHRCLRSIYKHTLRMCRTCSQADEANCFYCLLLTIEGCCGWHFLQYLDIS